MTDKKEKDKKCLKIIFQVTNFNIFQSTSIGYLFEISQNHEVVLMTEKLNSNIEKIIKDKKLFPGIKKIIFFNSPFRKNILLKNFNLYNKTKKIIKNYKPDIVIAPSDIWPAEMYLMRLAKRIGAITVAIQGGFKIAEQKKLYLWSCLKNSYSKSYRILPSFIRIFFVKIKKYLGYYLYHWILPLLNIEKPFIGRPSFIFWDESSGLRDADYSIVFSKRDYDLSLLDGVSRDKLLVINHPLDCKTTISLFRKIFFLSEKIKTSPKNLTVMWPNERFSFRNDNYRLISEKEINLSRIKIIKLLSGILKDWKIFIKPHPSFKGLKDIKNLLTSISNNIIVTNPSDPAEKYIETSKVILGMPLPSTTILSASKNYSNKIILYLNFKNEFLGDVYKNFNGIEYIDNENKFIKILNLIKDNNFFPKNKINNYKSSNINEALEYIYKCSSKNL